MWAVSGSRLQLLLARLVLGHLWVYVMYLLNSTYD